MRGKTIILALVLFMLPAGLLQLSFHPTSLSSSETESGPIDETIADSVAQGALFTQFYENIGQLNTKDVMFYGGIPGGMIGFGESKIHLWMEGTDSCVLLSFVGASNVTPACMDEVSQHTSHFLGDRGTYIGIRGYSQIVYEELWPGIDLHYHPTVDGVKYEFHITVGGNPTDIIVRCEGHDSLAIGESMVLISKDNGTFIDEGLCAFQGLTDVDVTFSSHGPRTFGFKVGDYDESQELIIDPLVYSTFVGGSGSDETSSIAVDSSGNVYVTGRTYLSDFPTVNAYNSIPAGEWDCFVFKLSADGSTLLYSTFVGGRSSEESHSIAVDSSDNAYVTGHTNSPDFPMVNAYNSTYGGGETWGDCFVFKFSADGSTLLYSTFVGGNEYDRGYSIAVDLSGNAYVTGRTKSPDFPTLNAYNGTYGGSTDCFVFKLSADGSTLLYSTFVGGSGDERAYSITVDSSGNAYVTGYTGSSNFPVHAYNSTYWGRCFVFKLSADGSTLLYSTRVGGRSWAEGHSIAVDSSGNAYVTGHTESPGFPMVNAYNGTYGGSTDCFVFKLSANGSTLLYSTYVGGGGNDREPSIGVDSSGNAYVTGYTSSPDFPIVNAYNSTYAGEWDCFVFKLSANGSTLLNSTFIGGSRHDRGCSIAVDSSGNAYVTGWTMSPDFPVYATNSTYVGGESGGDCFVLKLTFLDGEGLSTLESTTTTTGANGDQEPLGIHPLVLGGSGVIIAVAVVYIIYLKRSDIAAATEAVLWGT
ncbi:MAG: SBBP repeat-containing protein [Candidatus Thorarchaeota archaeon]